MNVLSLFSGIGGLDLGLQRAGMTICGQVEIDPWCRKVLEKHWPEVPRHDDVRTCAEWWGDRPSPDVICGGFPCQPFSSAGLRRGTADERWLWPAMADVIRQLRPRYALMENVPGFLAAGMGAVLGDLAACGYDAEWDCLPASAFSAPHQRDRVWIVAYPQSGREQPELTQGADAGGSQVLDRAGTSGGVGRRSAAARVQELGRGSSCRSQTAAHADREPMVWAPKPWTQRDPWPAEPPVGRVAHGIPRWVDRLRGLGNAVVPQVAEHIGHMIMEAAA